MGDPEAGDVATARVGLVAGDGTPTDPNPAVPAAWKRAPRSSTAVPPPVGPCAGLTSKRIGPVPPKGSKAWRKFEKPCRVGEAASPTATDPRAP
jgi:hypothetical protein